MAIAENKKRIVVTLSDEIVKNLEFFAKESGLSKSALITSWVNEKKKGLVK